MFWTNLLNILGMEAVTTVGMCLLACLCVAIIMRFFAKQLLVKADEYMDANHQADKASAIYASVKAVVYSGLAFGLTWVFLSRLFSVCTFPCENSKALAFLYYIPMVAVQFFLDKNLKAIACKTFGLKPEETEEEEEKPKKVKIHTKKVRYTIDEEGNEVALD